MQDKIKVLYVLALSLSSWCVKVSCRDTLEPMNVIRDEITMSGYSSGAAMAQMVQFSYSSMFRGVALFSQSFYRCGPPNGDIDDYDRFCTTLFNFTDSELYNPDLVHKDIQDYFAQGLIEDPQNLKGKRLYVYAGLRNFLFTPKQTLTAIRVYEPYIQTYENIKTRVQDAVQLLPTNHYGGPCTESAEDTEFIGNCGISGVTEAINFLLDHDTSEAFRSYNVNVSTLSKFDQTEFTRDLQNHSMDQIGFYYVPRHCQSKAIPCYLHIYYHGCFVGREFIGQRHIENSGLMELAERKGIIMIFPQALSNPSNMIGCWDTFGVAGTYYATQQGPQITAIKRMLDRILTPITSTASFPVSLRFENSTGTQNPIHQNHFARRQPSLSYLPPAPPRRIRTRN